MTVYLRDVEAGAHGFNQAWEEWMQGTEPPGVLILEVGPGGQKALRLFARSRPALDTHSTWNLRFGCVCTCVA